MLSLLPQKRDFSGIPEPVCVQETVYFLDGLTEKTPTRPYKLYTVWHFFRTNWDETVKMRPYTVSAHTL